MINTWASMQKAQVDRLTYINPVDERACSERACPALGGKPAHYRSDQAWFSCSVNKSLNNILER